MFVYLVGGYASRGLKEQESTQTSTKKAGVGQSEGACVFVFENGGRGCQHKKELLAGRACGRACKQRLVIWLEGGRVGIGLQQH